MRTGEYVREIGDMLRTVPFRKKRYGTVNVSQRFRAAAEKPTEFADLKS